MVFLTNSVGLDVPHHQLPNPWSIFDKVKYLCLCFHSWQAEEKLHECKTALSLFSIVLRWRRITPVLKKIFAL